MDSRLLAAATAVTAAAVGAALLTATSATSEDGRRRGSTERAVADEPMSSHASGSPEALAAELRGLRLRALRAKALEAGVSEESIEDALDADSPRGELVDLLLVAMHAQRQPAALELDALPATLKRAIGQLEQLALATTPAVHATMSDAIARAETALDTMGGDIARSGGELGGRGDEELDQHLAAATAAVDEISSRTVAPEAAQNAPSE